MNTSSWMSKWAWVAGAVLSLQGVPAMGAEAASASPGKEAGYGRGFDWVGHTQRTLAELRGKLNLAPSQGAAWDTWSAGVLKDAQQQLEQKKPWAESRPHGPMGSMDETTPERMARGIEHLRAQTSWMQEHLAQLEAAQSRTKVFYETLDKNQRTIFDLFWHEVHHRVSGHDRGWNMHERQDCGPGSVSAAPDDMTDEC